MIQVCISNDLCEMKGTVPSATDTYATFYHPLEIKIYLRDGTWRIETCWFQQEGVYLQFSDWQGNEGILLQNGLEAENNMYYIRVCGKGEISNSTAFENRINSAVRKYKQVLSKIYNQSL